MPREGNRRVSYQGLEGWLGSDDPEDWVRVCEEHDVPLNEDGTCPQCRDSNGQPFILDMQSYYLKVKDSV